jgi:hypothetical protein
MTHSTAIVLIECLITLALGTDSVGSIQDAKEVSTAAFALGVIVIVSCNGVFRLGGCAKGNVDSWIDLNQVSALGGSHSVHVFGHSSKGGIRFLSHGMVRVVGSGHSVSGITEIGTFIESLQVSLSFLLGLFGIPRGRRYGCLQVVHNSGGLENGRRRGI